MGDGGVANSGRVSRGAEPAILTDWIWNGFATKVEWRVDALLDAGIRSARPVQGFAIGHQLGDSLPGSRTFDRDPASSISSIANTQPWERWERACTLLSYLASLVSSRLDSSIIVIVGETVPALDC
jgi:hypothetical protein